MNHRAFEVNKFVGAGLMAALAASVIGVVGDVIVSPRHLEKPAYAVAAATPKAETPAEAPAAALEPITSLLGSASADAGKALFRQCSTCHTADKGGRNGVGPNLWDVVGNTKAHVQGYSYSAPLEAAAKRDGEAGTWSYEALNAFLANPKGYIPGTKMTFAGLRKPEDRANMIAYLRSLADSPKPLP